MDEELTGPAIPEEAEALATPFYVKVIQISTNIQISKISNYVKIEKHKCGIYQIHR